MHVRFAFSQKFSLILRISLGIFLLLSAGLKAHALFSVPTSDTLLFSPRLQAGTIEVELLIGLWLLTGWQSRTARWVAIALFSIFTLTNLYLAVVGQRSCGCFGQVEVSPWLTAALDILAVSALLVAGPPPQQTLSPFLETFTAAALTLALIGGTFLVIFPDPAYALARFRGEWLDISPSVCQLGEGHNGESRLFQLELRNNTRQPVRFIGGTTTCSCIATGDLPLTIPPGQKASIRVRARFSGSPGTFEHAFILLDDCQNQRHVIARFAGRVLPSG